MKTILSAILGVGLFLLVACAYQTDARMAQSLAPSETDASPEAQTPLASPVPASGASNPPTDPLAAPAAPVVIGVPFTYTLTAFNQGPSDATDVIITDTLPAGALFVSATTSQGSGCRLREDDLTHPPQEALIVICELHDLVAGARATITIVVTPITVTAMLTHSAVIAANEADPDMWDNTFLERAKISPAADLALRSLSPDPAGAGNTLIYTLIITNSGPSPATGVVLTDVLPLGASLAWSKPAQPHCLRVDSAAGCDLGKLEGGDAATVTLDISVNMTEALATGAMPAGIIVDLSTPSCTIYHQAGEQSGDVLNCQLGDLEPGAGSRVLLAMKFGTWTSRTITNTATVRAREADPNPADNHVSITSTLDAASPLTVTGTPTATDLVMRVDAPEHVIAGRAFTYSLTISNAGALDATGITLEDILPSGMTLHSVTPGWPACSAWDGAITCQLQDPHSGKPVTFTLVVTSDAEVPPSVTLDPEMPGWPLCKVDQARDLSRAVNCTLGPLAGNDRTRITFVASAGGVVTRIITNSATISANEIEINPSDNQVDTVTIVGVEADLAIQSGVSGPAIAGKSLSYTLTISNIGPSDATRVVFTDTLPLSVTLVSALATQGNGCQQIVTGTVTCNLGTLAGGEGAKVTIVVDVGDSVVPMTPEALINSAIVTADQPDPDPSNNQTSAAAPISAEADLSITEP